MKGTSGLSPLQYGIFLFNLTVGASIFTLPRVVGEVAKDDMLISVLLGILPLLAAYVFAVRLAAIFPRQTCVEYYQILLGSILGRIITAYHFFLFAGILVVALRVFTMLLKIFLFDMTPPQVIGLSFLVLAVYQCQQDMKVILRLQNVLATVSYPLIIMIIALGFLAVDTKHFGPFLAEGWTPVIKGIIPTYMSYSGPELIPGLLYPLLTKPKYALKTGFFAMTGITVLYVTAAFITQGILSTIETVNFIAPPIIAFREVEVPDTFVERLDGYLIAVWIPIYFTSLANFLSLLSTGTAKVCKLERPRPVVVILIPLLYYSVAAIVNMELLSFAVKILNYAGLAWGLIVLPLLLLTAWWKKRRRQSC